MINRVALISCFIFPLVVFAQQQEEIPSSNTVENSAHRDFKISGYIQAQFQHGERGATLKVSGPNQDPDKNFNRMGVRRGRVKVQYQKSIVLAVIQMDATEKGLALKDAYLKINIPRFGTSSVQGGVFNRPFGYEVAYSSSKRETPERAMINTTLFPEERDLGVMATFQAKKASPWYLLKLDIGLFAGNGVHIDIDNRKDLMARLSFNKVFKSEMKFSGGVSYYYDGVYQGTENVYELSDKAFVLNSNLSNLGKFAKREYVGLDAQVNFKTILGKTKLYGEFILGTQPGRAFSTKSPSSAAVSSSDTYNRDIRGAYLTLVQSIGKLPVSLVAKWDWYDPNAQVARHEIGLGGTGVGDIGYQTISLGALWQVNAQLRLQAFYEIVNNETTQNQSVYRTDIPDNVFTFRVQVKF